MQPVFLIKHYLASSLRNQLEVIFPGMARFSVVIKDFQQKIYLPVPTYQTIPSLGKLKDPLSDNSGC
jgi:hypothetical protein